MARFWCSAAAMASVLTAAYAREQYCVSLGSTPQDCHAEGSFVCTSSSWPPQYGKGLFGYCHKPTASSSSSLDVTSLFAAPVGKSVGSNSGLHGSFDKILPNDDGSTVVIGWAVDWSLAAGKGAVNVHVMVDGRSVYVAAANISRPDLQSHGAAPDPKHGLVATVPASVAVAAGIGIGGSGNHTVSLAAHQAASIPLLPLGGGKSFCFEGGRLLDKCGGDPLPVPWACCREPPNKAPLQPAPARYGKTYPLPPTTRPAKGEASVVLFLTDDQDIMLGSMEVMNNTIDLMRRGGTQFENFFVTTPVCCPSRISLLSGRWAHNTGAISTQQQGWCSLTNPRVNGNQSHFFGPGGMQRLALPTYVQAAGVKTGLFGKETNANDDHTISPGWDRFFALGGLSEGHYYADWFNDQGSRYNATQDEYMTELIRDRALDFIEEAAAAGDPFFAYIAPHAPHTRATPMPDTEGYFFDWVAPRLPSWNKTLSDHHWLVRSQPPMDDQCAMHSDSLYRNRLRALLGVDQLVGAVADKLLAHDLLDSTYFLYSSDHGFHLGEMSMPFFKCQPYDTDIRVPFFMRGPGIRPGHTAPQIGLNVDIAPTIADLLWTAPPAEALVDGKSLLPFAFGTNGPSTKWRTDFVFEFWAGPFNPTNKFIPATPGSYCRHDMMAVNNTYQAVRTADNLKYVDFRPFEDIEEAFNLTADPYEMVNLAKDPASQPWINTLRARLHVLKNCTQEECW